MPVHATYAPTVPLDWSTQIVFDDRGPRRQAETMIGAWLAGYRNPRTRQSYNLSMRLWLRFLDEVGVSDPIHEVNASHLEVWMRLLEDRGRAPATVGQRVGAVVVFFEWLVDRDHLVKSPMRKVRRPKVPTVSSTPWLSRRQLADWLDAGERLGGYDAVAALLLGLNALRVGELCSLDVESMGQERHHRTLRFVGKGDKPATIPVPPRTMYAIDAALAGRTSGPLLLTKSTTRDGKPHRANRESIARTVMRVCRVAGIHQHLTPHGLRHSAITAALECGVPIRDVQHFARHDDPKTTTRYDRARENLDKNASYVLMAHLGK